MCVHGISLYGIELAPARESEVHKKNRLQLNDCNSHEPFIFASVSLDFKKSIISVITLFLSASPQFMHGLVRLLGFLRAHSLVAFNVWLAMRPHLLKILASIMLVFGSRRLVRSVTGRQDETKKYVRVTDAHKPLVGRQICPKMMIIPLPLPLSKLPAELDVRR